MLIPIPGSPPGITLNNDISSNFTVYPVFARSSGQALIEYVSISKLTYNPSTGTFGATSFSGAGTGLTGTAASLTAGNATLAAAATNVAGGGTNQIVYQSATGSTTFIAAPTVTGQFLQWNGTAMAWTSFNGVTSFSAGTTGFTPSTSSTGAITLAGTLNAANGGTGVAGTITGYVYANGTSAYTAATTIPNTAITGLGTMSTQNASSVAITGGSINGTTIGGSIAAAGSFTTLGGSTITASTQFSGPGTGLTGTAAGLSIGGTAALATSLAGGSAEAIPYQSSLGVTNYLAAGTAGSVLTTQGTGSAPTWTTSTGTGNNVLANAPTVAGTWGTFDALLFNTGFSGTSAAGKMFWNTAYNTMSIGLDANVSGLSSLTNFFYIKASSAISIGQVVMFSGAVGASGVLTGAPATGVTDGSYIMGIAAENIASGAFGYVQSFGPLKGFDTSAFVDGQILWFDPTVAGGLTATQPVAPNIKVQVAAVIHAGSGSSGSVQIRVTAGSVLGGTDANVKFTSLANNDLIQYNSSAGYWFNTQPSTITGVGSANNIAGGSTNQVPYQTGAGATSFITAPTTANQVLTWNGAAFVWAVPAGSGTVTSVNASGGTTGLSFTGGPVTTSGTLTLGGTLGVANGGTGLTSLTAGYIPYGNGTGALASSANMTFNGTKLTLANDALINGLTVGKGGGAGALNTAVGAGALGNNSGNNVNLAVGPNALNSTTTGIYNIGISYLGGGGITTGSYNIGIGAQSLNATCTGSNNIGVGYQSLYSNTSGASNVAFGSSLTFNTTGSYNTAIGNNALGANTTASNNTAVGYQAGYNNNANYNTSIGTKAGYNITSGTENISIGYSAGAYNNAGTGTANINIGDAAGYNLSSGSTNTTVGHNAFTANTTGSNNVALGGFALQANTTASNNTAVGYQSAYSATGYGNTFIGQYAGHDVTSGNNNTILGSYSGNQGGLDIRTASGYIVLSDGNGNPRLVGDASGNIFVGANWTTGYQNVGSIGLEANNSRVIVNHSNGASSGSLYMGFGYNGGGVGSITQAGTTGVLYNVTSDRRLKSDIAPLTDSGSLIDALLPRTFTWNADGSKAMGFITDEYQQVFPNAITGEKDAVDAEGKPVYQQGDFSTSEFMAVLVAEIQSLRARLKAANIA